MKGLSPEGRYLFLYILLFGIDIESDEVDFSRESIKKHCGSSYKVIDELLGYFQMVSAGKVKKVASGKRMFVFDKSYLDSIPLEGSERERKLVEYVLESDKKAKLLKEAEHFDSTMKLRNSNLLLILIFLLKSDELGYVVELSDSKLRKLMGNISSSRLKSQMSTLSRIGFVQEVASGGVSSIYFGKFNKRYFINKAMVLGWEFKDKILINHNVVSYQISYDYLTRRFLGRYNDSYEFDFELPFKLSFLLHLLFNQNAKKIKVNNAKLDKIQFPNLSFNYMAFAILNKVERITPLILVSYWDELKGIESGQKGGFDNLKANILVDENCIEVLSKEKIFTQEYINKAEQAVQEEIHGFWKQAIISFSLSLARSLQKLCSRKTSVGYTSNPKISQASMLLYGFKDYDLSRGYLPSFGVRFSFLRDSEHTHIHVAPKERVTNNFLIVRRFTEEVDRMPKFQDMYRVDKWKVHETKS